MYFDLDLGKAFVLYIRFHLALHVFLVLCITKRTFFYFLFLCCTHRDPLHTKLGYVIRSNVLPARRWFGLWRCRRGKGREGGGESQEEGKQAA